MRLGWPRTLTLRIMLAEVAAILVVAVLLPLLLVSVLHATAAASQDAALADQARAIAARLHAAGGGIRADAATLQRYGDTYDGRAFVVAGRGGTRLAESRHAARVPWNDVPLGPAAFVRAVPFRFASLPLRLGGAPVWVLVSQDETRPGVILDDVMRAFLSRYLLILLPVLLLLPLVNALLIRRIVLAVRETSTRAATIGPRSLDTRLDPGRLPAEIVPLVAATNRLLDRLEQSFNQQAEFVANVVHELRTPLSTLRVRLEGVADPTVRLALERQVERLAHVIAQLRELAALEAAAAPPAAPVALADLAQEVVADLAPAIFTADHRIALVAPEPAVAVLGNAVLIRSALANLVANALRHTPAGTAIEVVLGAGDGDGEGAWLRVEDDGPGIVAGGEPARRFWRADHSRSDSAGLGLAIVRRIMEVHGGTLAIGPGSAGGTRATLRFPAAA